MVGFFEWLIHNELVEHENGKIISWKQTCHKGTRDAGKDDLSSDYKGHMDHMGAEFPFKCMKGKNKKPVAKVGSGKPGKGEYPNPGKDMSKKW